MCSFGNRVDMVLQTVGVCILAPILPRLKLQFFNGDSVLTTRVQTAAEVVRAAFLMLTSGKLGSLSDTIGRRPLIFLGSATALVKWHLPGAL